MSKRIPFLASALIILFALFYLFIFTENAYAIRWDFTSSVEGWTARGNATIQWSSNVGGNIFMYAKGSDPGMVSPSLSLNASSNNIIRMYVSTYCPDKTAEIFFMRSGSGTVYSGGTITLTNGTGWGTYEFDMRGNANYTGTITQLRIDPAGNCGTITSPVLIAFDWIETTGYGTVTGGVRDAVTNAPLSGATVRLEQNSVIKYTTTTNVNGVYTITNVAPGNYNDVGLATGYQNASIPITVYAGQTTSQNLALTPSTGTVTGGVRDALTNNPLVGAAVRLEQDGVIKYGPVYTNSTGNYTISNVTPGTYNDVGLANGYQNASVTITVSAGQTTSQNLALMPLGTVTGGVRDAVTLAPLSGATVRLEQSGVIKYTTTTDINGVYTINNVVPGNYNDVGLATGYQNASIPITVYAGQTTSQNLALTPSTGTVTGGVRDALTNNPLVGAAVRLEQGGVIKYGPVYTNSTGNYTISNVVPGNYNDVGLATGYENRSIPITVYAGQTTSQNLALTPLQTGVTLTFPANNSTTSTNSVYLSWNAVPGAVAYELWVDDSSTFQHPEIMPPNYPPAYLPITTNRFPSGSGALTNFLGDNEGSNIYYWRVKAKFADGTSTNFSDVWTFTYSPSSNPAPVFVPLYRYYKGGSDPNTGKDHFYTANKNEIPAGYNFEKIECYVSDRKFTDNQNRKSAEMFRLYNPSTTTHYYTTNPNHKNGKIIEGFVYEGIAGFVYSVLNVEGMVPLYRLEKPADSDHFFTISEVERNNAITKYSYMDRGIAMFVARNSASAPLAGKPTAKQSGIDMASGNFQPYYNHIDFANPPGKGIPFVFARTYNAMNAGDSGPLGPGWNHSYNIRIVEDTANGIAIVKWGDGRDDYYTINGTSYDPYPGIYDILTKSGSTFILSRKDMTTYTFEIYSLLIDEEGIQKGSLGRLTRIEDRNGNPIVLIYDADGNLNTVREGTEMTDRSYMFSYEINDSCSISNSTDKFRIAWIMEQDASLNYRNIRFGYDEKCNLVKYWDTENNLTQYEYNEDNMLTKIILPKGNNYNWQVDYYPHNDPQGRQGKIKSYRIDQETATLDYIKNADGSVDTSVNIPVAGQVQTTSCNHNNFKVQLCKDGLYKTSKILAYDLPTNPNLPTQIEDKNGKTWGYTYNTKGNILTATTPLNEITSYEYNDPIHTGILLTKVTDPEGNITRYEYDANGNLWKTINVDMINGTPYDRVTRIERYTTSEWNGLIKSVTDPRNNTNTYEYDSRGYLSKIIDPLGKITQFTYDAGGRLLSKTDADNVTTTYTYDNMNRVKTVKDHQLKTTTYNYDANGNLESVDDPRPAINEKIYSYNNRDMLESVTEANMVVATQGYDDIGRLTSIKNAKNRTWQMTYDPANNLKSEITPLGFTDSYPAYDGNGNVTTFWDRTNRTITYNYDDAGRLKDQIIQSGGQYSFNYLKNGLLQTASFPNQSSISSYEYTTRSQIKNYSDPFGKTVDYTYDEAGNLKTITFNGKTVTYNYDQRNLLESVTDWLNRTTWCNYTDAGRLSRITYPNGTYIEYIYDPANPAKLQILNNRKSDTTLIAGYAVGTFDALDAPEQITTSGGIEPGSQSYDSGVIEFDANNRIMNTGFDYNNQGELKTKTMRGVTTTFSWDTNDVPGRLKSISSGGSINNYVYDALGNLVAVTKDGVTTRYVLDASGEMSNIIAETDASGNIKAYYIYGLGLISKILPDGTARYYHYDMIGNTVALTDDSGNVTDQYAYSIDPYGFSITSQGSTENPFKFVGRYGVMDEGNNIFYMRARYYDAETGRFLNEDPLGFEGGDFNLYAYVGGNPIVEIDPSGLWFLGALKEIASQTIKGIVKPILKEAVRSVTKASTNTLEYIRRDISITRLEGTGKGSWSVKEIVSPEKLGKAIIGGLLNEAFFYITEGETKKVPFLSWVPVVGDILFRAKKESGIVDEQGNVYDSQGRFICNIKNCEMHY